MRRGFATVLCASVMLLLSVAGAASTASIVLARAASLTPTASRDRSAKPRLTLGPKFRITSTPVSYSPDIQGNLVVWQLAGLNVDAVLGKNIATGWRPPSIRGGVEPRISGKYVVCSVIQNFDRGYDVVGLNLRTGKRFVVSGSDWQEIDADISGPVVVWADQRNDFDDIYAKNLSTGAEFPVCTDALNQGHPKISGNIVVWYDEPSGDLLGRNIATGTDFTVCAAPGLQLRPAIDGSIIVWTDLRNGAGDIYGFNVATGKEFVVCRAPGDQDSPAIDGKIVVWSDERNGNRDIYGVNLSTGQRLTICRAPGDQDMPAISNRTVVWSDDPGGYGRIWGRRLLRSQ